MSLERNTRNVEIARSHLNNARECMWTWGEPVDALAAIDECLKANAAIAAIKDAEAVQSELSAKANFMLGQAYFHEKKYQEASASFYQAALARQKEERLIDAIDAIMQSMAIGKTYENVGLYGDLLLALGRNQEAIEAYQQLGNYNKSFSLKLSAAHSIQMTEHHRANMHIAAFRVRKENNYVAAASKIQSGRGKQRLVVWNESVGQGAIFAGTPAGAIAAVGAQIPEIGFPLIIGGAVAAVGVGAVGVIPGAIHGFFRAFTRNPLTIEEQKDFVGYLKTLTDVNDVKKQNIIDRIVAQYKATKTFASSKSSQSVLTILEDRTATMEKKWASLEGYVLQPYGKLDLLLNNGKKLFTIIRDVTRSEQAKVAPQQQVRPAMAAVAD